MFVMLALATCGRSAADRSMPVFVALTYVVSCLASENRAFAGMRFLEPLILPIQFKALIASDCLPLCKSQIGDSGMIKIRIKRAIVLKQVVNIITGNQSRLTRTK